VGKPLPGTLLSLGMPPPLPGQTPSAGHAAPFPRRPVLGTFCPFPGQTTPSRGTHLSLDTPPDTPALSTPRLPGRPRPREQPPP